MAEMTFVIIYENEKTEAQDVLYYEWSRAADAPCDAIRLSYIPSVQGEARKLKAYCNGECVFSGFVDMQSRCSDEKGEREFIYARSTACLLVDNEAELINYKAPCVNSLFTVNAKPFGFKNNLNNYSTTADYSVLKGTSCYGAINTFISAFEDKALRVSPENELYIPSGKVDYCVDPDSVISVKESVNRGSAVSRIDYKTDGGYSHHRASRELENKSIVRSRKMNMSSLPEWQRKTALSNMLKRSAEDYYSAEITVEGVAAAQLYSSVIYDGLEGYYITALDTVFNNNGAKTKISLRKGLSLREVDYVA